ncbi:hypothetical protein GF362_01390 [Candidatus Dojkabacteria bacterium]|nr:hypothetical protein [Candidatus Dojkabacteria bacterium]
MKILKKEAKKVQNSPDCTVWEYEFPSELMSFATCLIDGRYPDKGRVSNTECEEIYFVLSGDGTVHSEEGDFDLAKGDMYAFKKGEKYWVEGNEFRLALFNAPKWTPEQHEIIS